MNKFTTFLSSPDGSDGGSADNGNSSQDWEARFKGLQATLNQKEQTLGKKVSTLESTVAAVTSEAHDWKSQLETLQKSMSGKVADYDTVTKERDTLRADAATAAKQVARMKSLTKFPELFGDDDKQLLRTDLEGEAFDTYLKNYAERLGASANNAIDKYKAGGSAAGGSNREGAPTREQLMSQLNAARNNGNRQEYDQIYSQVMQLDEAKK